MSNTPQGNPTTPDYAGDVSADEAWAMLESDPGAQLLDCRSAAEWSFVGVPDLSPLKKRTIFVELQSFPGMAVNPRFIAEAKAALEKSGGRPEAPVLCICRSGGRSRAAAIQLTQAGYSRAYNVAGGFEGDVDAEGHRGTRNGWKYSGHPWRQT